MAPLWSKRESWHDLKIYHSIDMLLTLNLLSFENFRALDSLELELHVYMALAWSCKLDIQLYVPSGNLEVT